MPSEILVVNDLLKHLFNVASYAAPSQLYLALTSAGVELGSGIGYSRQAIAFRRAQSREGDYTASVNLGRIVFGPNTDTGAWGLGGFAVYDAATGGNRIAEAEASFPTVDVDEMLIIRPGQLAFGMSGGLSQDAPFMISDHARRRMLDHLFAGQSYTAPAVYVALAAGFPLADSEGALAVNEPDGQATGYARVQQTGWSVADYQVTNTSGIAFPEAQADYSADHFALLDAATGGNPLAVGPIAGGVELLEIAEEHAVFETDNLMVELLPS